MFFGDRCLPRRGKAGTRASLFSAIIRAAVGQDSRQPDFVYSYQEIDTIMDQAGSDDRVPLSGEFAVRHSRVGVD